MNVRRKIYKKRTVASMFWSLGGSLQIAVKLFNLVQRAYPSKHVSVDLRTSKLLRVAGAHICNDTGSVAFEAFGSFEARTFKLLVSYWEEHGGVLNTLKLLSSLLACL